MSSYYKYWTMSATIRMIERRLIKKMKMYRFLRVPICFLYCSFWNSVSILMGADSDFFLVSRVSSYDTRSLL